MICFEGFKAAFFEFSENPLLLFEVPSASGVQLLLDVIADLKA
jgi:dihydrodipicolinate synthase/N-acetylneuraminate lyase